MAKPTDVRAHNRRAWNCEVAGGNPWTVPVTKDTLERARSGEWSVVLTPTKAVPRDWFGTLDGARVLGLASGGGQQCPVLAAAGARVTLLDNSPAQLERDRTLAAAHPELSLECVEGDMADLSLFADDTFDLIFHPVSNCFVADVRPVWREAHRVLRPGGALLSGFANPTVYMFDDTKLQQGEFKVRHALPYSDLTSIPERERESLYGDDEPLAFGHTLTDQIGGQIDAGFAVTGFYEDRTGRDEAALDRFMDTYIATCSVKLPLP